MLDDLIRDRNLNMIVNVLDDSRNVMEKLIAYDDIPSQAFEESIIKDANILAQKLLSSKLLLENMHGD
tara:strand:+ start:391 stop:594 length:204 start_codon:yes stop_codon:yes gene_type:complete